MATAIVALPALWLDETPLIFTSLTYICRAVWVRSPATEKLGTAAVNQKKTAAFVQRLGPGMITGAADDDPSGIATYSQAGAQFRFGLVWTLLLTTPLMIGIQMLSARIGWVTGRGLTANIDELFPRWLTTSLVSLGLPCLCSASLAQGCWRCPCWRPQPPTH